MVRLEALSKVAKRLNVVYFNSKMVRLEEFITGKQDNWEIRFQFQNGTIRSQSENVILQEDSAFQFQNGTIRRRGGFRNGLLLPQFQFQNGTIRSSTYSG